MMVYEVNYDPQLESDVQDVFIASLAINQGMLEVINEKRVKYVVDLKERRVLRKESVDSAVSKEKKRWWEFWKK